MSDFPHELVEQTQVLTKDMFEDSDVALIGQLADQGYEVQAGLTAKYADDIAKMCLQPSIKEFCPNDSGRRFKDRQATEQWLAKGRGAFLLIKKDDQSLVGYGWAGDETSSHASDGQTTFAIRIGEEGQGQGLATPFARLILSGAAQLYGARDFWLETWASNGGAVHVYHKIGFEDVDQAEDSRPTTGGEPALDVRLYMSLANGLL